MSTRDNKPGKPRPSGIKDIVTPRVPTSEDPDMDRVYLKMAQSSDKRRDNKRKPSMPKMPWDQAK